MGKRFRFAACAGLAAVFLTTVLWATSRLSGPPDAQQTALATMRKLPPLQGADAFAVMRLMHYDVPEAQWSAILAEDLKRQRMLADADVAQEGEPDALSASSIAARFPDQSPSTEDFGLFCGGKEACLQKVAADPVSYRALIARHGALLGRVETLQAYQGMRQPLQGMATEFPPYQYGKLPATRYALQFLEGHRSEAFEGVCRGVDTWRRLGTDSDILITRMIGVAYSADIYGRLFVDMLAQTPRDFTLPTICDQAFAAPTAKEQSFCQSMQGEFAYLSSTLLNARTAPGVSMIERALLPIVLSEEMTLADSAEQLAFYCSADADRAMALDQPLQAPRIDQGWLRFGCVGNPMGCRMTAMGGMGFDAYAHRVEDSNAYFRLVALLIRLREDGIDADMFAERLASAVSTVGDPSRAISITPDGRNVHMRNHYIAWREYADIPLPPYFQTTGVPSR